MRGLLPTLLVCAPALVQAGTISLVPIEAAGVEAAGRVVDGGLRAGVERTPVLTEKGPVQMSLEEARTSFSCFDEAPDCMSQVGAVLGSELLVWGQLSREAGDWSLRLAMLDVPQAKITRRAETRISDGPKAMKQLAEYADAFVRGQALPTFAKVALDVVSNPPGAVATVDGRDVGATPTRVEVDPGAYTIELRAPDGRLVRRDVRVGDTPVQVTVDLGASAKPGGKIGAGTWLGISTAVVAVAGIGMGAYYGLQVSDNEDEAAKLVDGDPRRAELEDEFSQNKVLSNVGWGVAIAAGAASAYFFLLHDDGGVAVAPGPGGLTVLGSF